MLIRRLMCVIDGSKGERERERERERSMRMVNWDVADGLVVERGNGSSKAVCCGGQLVPFAKYLGREHRLLPAADVRSAFVPSVPAGLNSGSS